MTVSEVKVSVLGPDFGDFWTDDGHAVALIGISSVVIVVFLFLVVVMVCLVYVSVVWLVVDVDHL